MRFISYAQNLEDVILWRALKAVEKGFYIDVGANDPNIDSVTRAFYERGWRGINIEPLLSHWDDLQRHRPEDTNLQCAAGETSGELDLWEADVRGWATSSPSVIKKHQEDGHNGTWHKVTVRTLAEICKEYVTGDIHFLKVDVEGFEQSVIAGMNFEQYRPWIVVVEATLPNSIVENYQLWESMLVRHGYGLVYADGLNRYYLAHERGDLAEAFKYPPNVFDGFVRNDQVLLEGSLQKAQEQLHQSQEHWSQSQEQLRQLQEHWSQSQEQLHRLQEQFQSTQESHAALQTENSQMRGVAARLQEVEDALAHASGQHAQIATQLAAVYASNSWRITAPLRKLSILVSSGSLRGKILTKVLLRYAAVRIERYPQLKRVMLTVLNRLPALKGRLARILVQQAPTILPVLRKGAEGGLLANPSVLPSAPNIPEAMLLPEVASSTRRWVRLVGHVEGHYSLAIVNRGLAGALEQVTQKLVSFVPYHGTPYAEVPNLPSDQDDVLHQALRRSIPAEAVDDAISIVHHYPFINDDLPAGQRGMVFFWEETSVPEGIIKHINASFDLVWVAAESVKRALINSGCSVPIFVIPIGIDHLVSDDIQPLGDLRVAEGQRFRFLHVSSVFERKGVDVLLASYLKAFTADDDVELYIKTFPNPHNQIGAQLNAISAEFERPARVVIDEDPLDDEGLLALYRTAHAMVLPTRGEGFNLPAAEALAMALPVITTGYGAQVDFCTRETSALVNFHFAPSRSHVRSSDSCWMEPDAADLTAKLRILHKRILARDPELNTQRQVALNHVRGTYRWENSARSLLASAGWLADYKPENKFEPLHLALVSPWATRCGIAEYSHKLLVAVSDDPGVQLNVYCDDRTNLAPANALVSWRLGANDTVPEVLDRIAKTDAQVVLVQHQPSLFPLSEICCQRLAALHDQGRVVVLELHSTLPLLEECRVAAAAIKLLAKLDRIIVHKPEDLNHMLALGLADNVMLLHHGVIQPLDEPHEQSARTELGIPDDALVLGCFGFALPHKGIDTLVEVIEPLSKAVGRTVHLVALNSILDARSEQIILDCQERARQLGVNDKISWITDYRSIETCQRLLGAADYIVFPYRDTRESASGAVTIGLSTLKPVLVSPLEIFSDLADVTWKMEGNGTADVLRAVKSLHAQSQLATDLIVRQRAWLQARDWSKLSTRLLTLMATLRRERQLADVVAPARHDWLAMWEGNQRKQLLVDVSEIYHRDARTGIQRVVRNVLAELFRTAPDGYEIRPVYGDKGQGFRYAGKFSPEGSSWRDGLPIEVRSGDIFLGLDLAAHLFPEAEQDISDFRLSGARAYYVIYDIIPLRDPHHTVAGITQAFHAWLNSLVNCADGLICISQAVARDVEAWLRSQFPDKSLPRISYFHLGADIDCATPAQDSSVESDRVLEAMKIDTSFLMVGTLEPRKGHEQVLDAFERLWRDGFKVNLVIAGKQGWMVDALAKRLRNHSEANKRLFWLEGVSDVYLEKLYAAGACLIAASYNEGFGLPLIEAAQHRLPIIARGIPVFREVAGKFAFYFTGEKPEDLAQSMCEWLNLYKDGSHPRSDDMPWLTWKESTKMMLENVIPVVESRE